VHHFLIAGAKVYCFSESCKFFGEKIQEKSNFLQIFGQNMLFYIVNV